MCFFLQPSLSQALLLFHTIPHFLHASVTSSHLHHGLSLPFPFLHLCFICHSSHSSQSPPVERAKHQRILFSSITSCAGCTFKLVLIVALQIPVSSSLPSLKFLQLPLLCYLYSTFVILSQCPGLRWVRYREKWRPTDRQLRILTFLCE